MKGEVFAIDESAVFDFQINGKKEWRNVVVGGISLNFDASCI